MKWLPAHRETELREAEYGGTNEFHHVLGALHSGQSGYSMSALNSATCCNGLPDPALYFIHRSRTFQTPSQALCADEASA